jgi:hypothetical protein
MGWYVLQCGVMIAVAWTGTIYKWTPNGLLLGLISIIAAWLVTVAITLAPTAWRLLTRTLRHIH